MTREQLQILFLTGILLILGYACENQSIGVINTEQNELIMPQAVNAELDGVVGLIKRNFTAHLNGEYGTTATDTKAQGQAIFQVSKDESSISYKLIVSNIENVLMAQIRVPSGEEGHDEHGESDGGCTGEDGCGGEEGDEGCGGHEGGEHGGGGSGGNGYGCQVAVWLYPSGGPPPQLIEGRLDGVLVEGTITADDLWGPLRGKGLDALISIMRDGQAYVLLATSEYHGYDGGEIRGLIK